MIMAEIKESIRTATHRNCGGTLVLCGDTYRCDRCKRGYQCVGQEQYLKDVLEELS